MSPPSLTCGADMQPLKKTPSPRQCVSSSVINQALKITSHSPKLFNYHPTKSICVSQTERLNGSGPSSSSVQSYPLRVFRVCRRIAPVPSAATLPMLLAAMVATMAALAAGAAPGVGARVPPPVEHRVGGEDALRAARRLAPRSDSLHGPAASGWSTEGGDVGGGGGLADTVADAGDVDPAPGCHPCSRSELQYCAGADVIHDHCCCDMRYHEAFPFVPHTCYLRETPCSPLAGDCQNYDRLRTCCCDKLLRQQWSPSNSPVASFSNYQVVMMLFLVLLLR